jgi:hypothetical protein
MANLHDALFALNSDIKIIRGEDAFNANEQPIQYDMAEAQAKIVELQAQEVQAEQAAKDAKASALAKLAALGLTADEIKALL